MAGTLELIHKPKMDCLFVLLTEPMSSFSASVWFSSNQNISISDFFL